MFDDLDQLLKARRTPEVPEGLSARIIGAVVYESQSASVGEGPLWDTIWTEFAAFFAFHRPVFVFAAVILVFGSGLLIGGSSEDFDFLATFSPDEIASFMTIDDRFVVEEWV